MDLARGKISQNHTKTVRTPGEKLPPTGNLSASVSEAHDESHRIIASYMKSINLMQPRRFCGILCKVLDSSNDHRS